MTGSDERPWFHHYEEGVVLRAGQEASAEEIASFSRLHLAAFKIPRQVEFRRELPRSLVGKYLRRVLVEQERARPRGGEP